MTLKELKRVLGRLVWMTLLAGLPLACLLGFVARGEDYLPEWWETGRRACGFFVLARTGLLLIHDSSTGPVRAVRQMLVAALMLQVPAAIYAVLRLHDHPFWGRAVEVFGPQDLAQRMAGLGDPVCKGVMALIIGWPLFMFLTKLARALFKPKAAV